MNTDNEFWNLPKCELKFYDASFKEQCFASNDENFLCHATQMLHSEFISLYQILEHNIATIVEDLTKKNPPNSFTRCWEIFESNFKRCHPSVDTTGLNLSFEQIAAFRTAMSHVKYKPHRSTHERLQRATDYLQNNPSDNGNPELDPFLGQGDYLNRFKANITNPLLMTLLKYDAPCNQDFIDSKNAIRKEHIGALFQNLYTIEQIVKSMGSVYTEYFLNVLQNVGDVLLVYNYDEKQMTIAFLLNTK